MNKKGQNQNSVGVFILVIAAFVAVIFALYFASHLLSTLGTIVFWVSFVILLVGLGFKEDTIITIGIIGLIAGVILWVIGTTGINFFENNPTGENLLESANTIVNTTKEGVESYSKIAQIPGGG